MDEFDLDRTTEVGWASFLSRLADHLATLAGPLTLRPLGGEDDGSPVLEVSVRDDGPGEAGLHAELRPAAGAPWADDDRSRHLMALGWTADPDRTAYLLELPRSHAHLLAAVMTDTLREVVGVPHPALLDAGELTIAAPAEDEQGERDAQPVPDLDLDTAVTVRTPAELRGLVDATLHAALGHAPRHDHDGDVPILFGSALVYVRTADAQPVVTVFAIPVQDIGDLEAARHEVEIFNRRSVFGKLHLVGRQLVASVSIPCLPFVPRHLVGMVELMGREIDRLDEDLALRVRGRRWIDLLAGTTPAGPGGAPAGTDGGAPSAPGPAPRASQPPEEEALPGELATMLQLDASGTALPPARVAEICHHDRDLILRLIRLAEERTIEARASVGRAGAAGDADAARSAGDEVRRWSRTVRVLRAALRHVVTFGGPGEG
ncbi:T3SS (YopN, CesT) and YbjN peptide-binding chaperone 1 [Ornithinimicrobium pekingense]|uniref:Uncharacterized protein n=1 Tax=Ornithinimicrobium pekingense TaxID=384677 RepID=A0ABQ2FAL0_9MICO|nr:hypothetical protein [Ornithinimicrobium pekingense]GGK70095.1 hypothetical protein GCM10011509_18140 [Ornithinimicrobium pekingense]